MLQIVKTTNFTKRMAFFCGLLVAAVFASMPISAGAQCANWDASGSLTIRQRGAGDLIWLELEQKGSVLTGTAANDAKTGSFKIRRVGGTVDGTINSDRFSIQIFWPGGLTGVYTAKVLPSGRLDGETYDKNNTKIRQTWNSEGVLKCLPAPTPLPPPVVPKVIKGTGRKPAPKPEAPAKTIESAASEMKVPGIIASQVAYEFPGAPTGYVILAWDGGPDHPYAEVWVSVNGGEPTFVVEQGKGQRRVVVARGKTYAYSLMDAGKKLSDVGFVVPRF